jgi:tetratricopeptide (TPR) repeat protein
MKDGNKLDVYRLMYATNSFGGPSDYTQMTETAIIANFPADGQRAMQKGFSAGVLGKSDQAAREKRLLDKATQTVQQDQAKLPGLEGQAKAQADGNALAKVGEAYLSLGQYDKAIPTLQQALQKGVTDQGASKLHLGIAYAGAKQNEKARQTWTSISTKDVNKQLAGLWGITLK